MSVPLVITDPRAMSAWSNATAHQGSRLAFVPTMGALHAGHAALLAAARTHGGRVVLSIFVNPIQFGPQEDLTRYPRTLDADLALAAQAGVDAVFVPAPATMYTPGFQTFIEVRDLSEGLCGASRPGHFVGVATVVCKLFHIVRPDVALFGEKDFQQLAVIRRMVVDLDLGITIVGLPTVREADGLAVSSRNRYLSPADRARAMALSRGLFAARQAAASGVRSARALVETARAIILPAVDRIEYLELRDANTLAVPMDAHGDTVLLVAAVVGGTRLIDNLRMQEREPHE